jgi:hypothetical protein
MARRSFAVRDDLDTELSKCQQRALLVKLPLCYRRALMPSWWDTIQDWVGRERPRRHL